LTEIGSALEDGHSVIVSVRFVPTAWFAASEDGWIQSKLDAPVVDGHAVLAVGAVYDKDRGDVIVFKNSWGIGWGDDGYGFLNTEYLADYGICAHRLERRTPT